MHTETGFLLYYIKYRDSDAVLHCFTKEKGFRTYFIKSIFTARNRRKSYLQPLNELVFKIREKSPSAMPEAVGIEPLIITETADSKIHSVLFFISDFLNLTLKEEGVNEEIYTEIKNLVSQAESQNYSAHLIFMIRFLRMLGIAPFISEEKFLDAESGTFAKTPNHALFDEPISQIWKTVLLSPQPYHTVIESKIRPAVLDSILLYYRYHHSGFKTPKSLDIIRQLW